MVSIHPMCRFKLHSFVAKEETLKVSIHPMCRFKRYERYLETIETLVSIHPMCRFKSAFLASLLIVVPSFNTSYVSVQVCPHYPPKKPHSSFNTSYVSVQELIKLISKTSVCVSIHPMCRFKERIISAGTGFNSFQYILCVGSRLEKC